jgi:hypothetical protein
MTQQKQPELPDGWRVTGPSGEIVSKSDTPTAAEMTSVTETETERGDDDAGDRAGSGE